MLWLHPRELAWSNYGARDRVCDDQNSDPARAAAGIVIRVIVPSDNRTR